MSVRLKGGLPESNALERPLGRGKAEVALAAYALLFSELVQYCHARARTIPDLQAKLAELGQDVGSRLIDLYFVREKSSKREIKLLNMCTFIKTTLWKALFGREAGQLTRSNDDNRTYYIMEKDPLVNKYISVPKDKGSLNCATFNAGIIEAVLTRSGFTAKVSAHLHEGSTAYMIKFDDTVITRDRILEETS